MSAVLLAAVTALAGMWAVLALAPVQDLSFLTAQESSSFQRATCTPTIKEVNTLSTSYITLFSCTSCAGWLHTVHVSHDTGTTGGVGTVQVSIDGLAAQTFDNDHAMNPDSSQISYYFLSRFKSNITIELKSSTGLSSAGGQVYLCFET